MRYTRNFGLEVREWGWVPAPRYLMRRAFIRELAAGWPVGRILEVGCGPGALLYDFCKRGFSGVGVDFSEAARTIAAKVFSQSSNIAIAASLDKSFGSFDYVVACEVLEHIDDDTAALRQWSSYLHDAGLLLLSVPCHRSRWSELDVRDGHVRRYERSELCEKLRTAGFEVLRVINYGWPVSSFLAFLRRLILARRTGTHHLKADQTVESRQRQTEQSGVDRAVESKYYGLYANPFGAVVFAVLHAIQKPLTRCEFGNGYIALARKRA